MSSIKTLNEVIKDIKNVFHIRDKKKSVLLDLPYFFFFYIGNMFSRQINSYTSGDFIDRSIIALSDIKNMSYLPFFRVNDLLTGIIFSVVTWFIVYNKRKNTKKLCQGREYGSARWGSCKDIEPYVDEKFENSILPTNTEWFTMNSRLKIPKYTRNKNMSVVGGFGSGRIRSFVKPNLMQIHSSHAVTDLKGTVFVGRGKMLEKNGYEVKVLDIINFKKSMHCNPLAYLRSEKDISKLVQTIVVNIKEEGEKSSEDFWMKVERLYYTALIGHLYYEAPTEEQNFATLLVFIDASKVREEDENFKSAVNYTFEALEKGKPSHFTVKRYKKYELAVGVVELRGTLNHCFNETCTS